MARPPAGKPPASQALTVTSRQFADILGVDPRTIRDYDQTGKVVKLSKDTYDFLPSIKKLFDSLREQAARRVGEDKSINLMDESALLKRAVRQRKEIELAIVGGEVIPVARIEEVMSDHIQGLRAMVLSFPEMAQAEMPHLTPMDKETLRNVARQLLKNNAVREIEATGQHPELTNATESRTNPSRNKARTRRMSS